MPSVAGALLINETFESAKFIPVVDTKRVYIIFLDKVHGASIEPGSQYGYAQRIITGIGIKVMHIS